MKNEIVKCDPECLRLDKRWINIRDKEIPGGQKLLEVAARALMSVYSVLDIAGQAILDRQITPRPERESLVISTCTQDYVCSAADNKLLERRETQQLMRRTNSILSLRYRPVGKEKVLNEPSLSELPCLAPDRKEILTQSEKELRLRLYRPPSGI